MDLQLQGKRALVTGGSRGIGRAIALALAHEGCDVAICARGEAPLKEAAAALAQETGRKVVGIVCDTLDPASIKRFVKQAAQELGGVDVLVNSAARVGGALGTIETVDEADVLHDFEEKVVGYLRCAREAIPFMKEAGWGRIINISGGAGRSPGTAISGAVRNVGTINLTKSMANALGPAGINVNAIYPGATVTEATFERNRERAQRENTTVEALMAQQAEQALIRHLVTAEDVASVVTFLCSPLSIGITGEAIAVNGGTSVDTHF